MNDDTLHDLLPGQHPDPELIAIWLDDPEHLDAETQTTLAGHLGTCAACRELAEDLVAIVEGLGALPPLEPARPLTIQQPVPVKRAAGLVRRFPLPSVATLRWATIAASFLLVLSLGAGALGLFDNSSGGGSDGAQVAVERSAAESADSSMLQDETRSMPAAAATEPPAMMATIAPAATDLTATQPAAEAYSADDPIGEATAASAVGATTAAGNDAIADTAQTPEPAAAAEPTLQATEAPAVTQRQAYEESPIAGAEATDKQGDISETETSTESDSVSALQIVQVGLLFALGWILLALLVARRRDRV